MFQSIFKNPLVSSDLLGVSNGAGFGAALAIILSGSNAVIQIFAFVFGLISAAKDGKLQKNSAVLSRNKSLLSENKILQGLH